MSRDNYRALAWVLGVASWWWSSDMIYFRADTIMLSLQKLAEGKGNVYMKGT